MTREEDGARPGWRLDQVASAGRENLDAQHVARYDAIEDASPEREVALLRRWGMGQGSVVVELGAGTGQSNSSANCPGSATEARTTAPSVGPDGGG
ncbi:hypothetical protein TEK04_18435 [Klenkia sp. LSe6-5]|uniref:Uncharacterized protein n=1 Tax=Klenkia sesuvii TaxID=3103137 RepID=A0ABU8DYI0_9ACTN